MLSGAPTAIIGALLLASWQPSLVVASAGVPRGDGATGFVGSKLLLRASIAATGGNERRTSAEGDGWSGLLDQVHKMQEQLRNATSNFSALESRILFLKSKVGSIAMMTQRNALNAQRAGAEASENSRRASRLRGLVESQLPAESKKLEAEVGDLENRTEKLVSQAATPKNETSSSEDATLAENNETGEIGKRLEAVEENVSTLAEGGKAYKLIRKVNQTLVDVQGAADEAANRTVPALVNEWVANQSLALHNLSNVTVVALGNISAGVVEHRPWNYTPPCCNPPC